MALLARKISVVQGTMTVDGASIKTTETFFGKVDCQGIILRNISTYDEAAATSSSTTTVSRILPDSWRFHT